MAFGGGHKMPSDNKVWSGHIVELIYVVRILF